MDNVGVVGRMYLDEGLETEGMASSAADWLVGLCQQPNGDPALELDLGGRREADVARIVCYLEARATRPNDIDRGQYELGERNRDQDLGTAERIRAAYEAMEGRPLRWAPKPTTAD